MFDIEKAKGCLGGLIGWKNHYDTNEIPVLPTDLTESETGEYYQEIHPAMRLDLIKSTLPKNRDLAEYLQETEDGAVIKLLNDLTEGKHLKRIGKTILSNDVIYNTAGWVNDTVINESRFVG